MTSKYLPADLERRWKQGKLTVEQMIGQFLVYLKDHQQSFALHERRLDEAETQIDSLEEWVEALEAGMATMKEQLSEISASLRGSRGD